MCVQSIVSPDTPLNGEAATTGVVDVLVPLATGARLYVHMTTQRPEQTTRALLDVNQVADRMCVSPRFVRRLVEERRIPFCKLGKFVRFDPVDIDAWIEARRVEPAS